MIGIRADGNNQIGIGHIMRCLTIADEFNRQGEDVIFILADGNCETLVRERGFDCVVLGTLFDDMEEELETLADVLDGYQIRKMLIDSYYVTPRYLEVLRQDVITIYIDDVDAFPYPVDILINYNVFAKATDYPYGIVYNGYDKTNEIIKDEMTYVMAGPLYAPVRKEFLAHSITVKEEVKKILVTLGGSDAYNLTGKIAEALLDKTTAEIHLVCGPFNLHKVKLYALATKDKRVNVHENVKEMWALMEMCDLAVSAAGSTMCELSAAGVPSVTFSFVDNQKRIAETFGAEKAALTSGHFIREQEASFVEGTIACVEQLVKDKVLREKVVGNARRLVDGKGAERIAKAVINYIK